MLKTPKYLYSKVENGPKPGEYIIRTASPRCIARIAHEDGKVRVYMVEQWEPMDADKEKKLCLEMKNWYYFTYIQPTS